MLAAKLLGQEVHSCYWGPLAGWLRACGLGAWAQAEDEAGSLGLGPWAGPGAGAGPWGKASWPAKGRKTNMQITWIFSDFDMDFGLGCHRS